MDQLTLRSFLESIQAKVSAVDLIDGMYAKRLAVNFSSLNFVRWDENKVSELLAFFLDPNANHQQGDIFLKLFIEHFDIYFPYSDISKIRVKVEETTLAKRRVDIVISYDNNKRVIGIENKIYYWTKDQDNQLADYVTYLSTMSNNEDYHLFYLAPKSKVLSQQSIGKEQLKELVDSKKLIMINYEDDIIPLLKKFAMHAENERVRIFLTDFELRLKQEYLGNEQITGNTMISNYIKQNTENLKMAFFVHRNINQVKEDLKKDLQLQMDELAEELNIEYNSQHHHFIVPEMKNFYIKFSFEFGGLIYGIVKTPEFFKENYGKLDCISLKEYLQVKFNTSPWWPIYLLKYPKIEVQEELWQDILSGKFKNFMRDFILQIRATPRDLLHQTED
ncbi:MAG: PD-(D/E)XK nuclease family protein [Bacteroidota bacterium]